MDLHNITKLTIHRFDLFLISYDPMLTSDLNIRLEEKLNLFKTQ